MGLKNNKIKVFMDLEFTGLQKDTDIISIGLISENEQSFYAELIDYDKNKIDNWLQENVIDNLLFNNCKKEVINSDLKKFEIKCNKEELKNYLIAWFNFISKEKDSIEIWSDCLSYDWVLFCDIFGHAFNIPKQVYYIPFDICTLMRMKDIDPDISRESILKCYSTDNKIKKHNAFWDTYIISIWYYHLKGK